MSNGNQCTGFIFDIQRFSLDDGPGIRTSVFLKGCPLHCLWCQNPEGIDQHPRLSFDVTACTLCRKCLLACPNHVHSFEQDTHILDRSKCSFCGECVSVCLTGALKMAGKSMTAPEVLAEVLKDKPFYVQSGGGMTLTGGEPLFQAGFAEALLKEARKHNLHTCVETSGYAAKQTFIRILPFTDIFLFDLKLQDATLHKKFTGTSNSLILSNLLFLNRNHASIHLRCPVIPHVNDNERHFRWLAETMRVMEHIESVELIPYHTYGLPKYLRFDIPVQLPEHTIKPEPEYIKTMFKHILQESSISLVQFENSLLWKRK